MIHAFLSGSNLHIAKTSTGVYNPNGVQTPSIAGELFLNLTDDTLWAATDTTSTGWALVSGATELAQLSDDPTHRLVTDTEKSTWSGKQDFLGYTPENVSNKISAFQAISDDIHYPSEKLTKDSLDGKSATDHNHNLNDLSEKSYNSLTDTPLPYIPIDGATPVTFVPANPTGTSQSSYRMMGLGSTLTFTPLKSGRIRFTINGKNLGSVANLEIYIKIAYGTGVAPANGVAASGTIVGAAYTNGVVATAGGCTSVYSNDVVVPGLSIGVAYWFDLQMARGSVSGTVSIVNITATFEELPY